MTSKNHRRKLSEETKLKIGLSKIGRPRSEKTKEKISKALIGREPWNKGKKNIFSEETLLKISKAHKGKTLPKEHKRKISKANKGHKVSEETRRKIGVANKGKIISIKVRLKISKTLKGRKLSEETKFKISKANKEFKGIKNRNWKGGRIKTNKGYIYAYKPEHPYSNCRGYVLEHRLIMEEYLGRILKPKEVVHHKGTKYPIGSIENKSDNRIENLILFENDIEHRKYEKKLKKNNSEQICYN